uniref:ATP synthase CF1 delta subunit n=1 Tax=Gloiopeltis furcata TaxID=42017 RepID=UPI0028D3CFD4|nr:ATP synthase CF1 delta subunit [Gloiopeltis furcata]WMP13879.1 ATP synthase CF1 delta subunit [Gloiopeltis furcata]
MSSQSAMAKVALPYAEALLDSARSTNSIKKMSEDVSLIADILSKSLDLKLFLKNPLIENKVKKAVLNKLFVEQTNTSILNFLSILVDRGRITLLSLVLKKYLELAYQLDSTTVVQVTTSLAFTESQQKTLIEKLKEMTQSKQVKLMIQVDSKLIGGFKIQIGSKVIDTSLAGKLQQIALYLNKS